MKLQVLLAAAATALMLAPAPAHAAVQLPNGATAETTIGCDRATRTLDVTTSFRASSSPVFVKLWSYSNTTRSFTQLTGWERMNTYKAVGPISGQQDWVAFYARYAVFVNGAWRYAAEWVVVNHKFDGTTGYWCFI